MARRLLALLITAIRAAADCQCGYAVNATSSDAYSLFFQKLETNFLVQATADLTWDSQSGLDWQAQEYNTTPAAARGPYGKAAQLENVVLNPLPQGSTGGQGAHGGDPGLQLWVRSHLLNSDGGSGQMVPIAEVVTARSDILYGTFRVGMKTTGVNGTCGAFFFYHNDSQEIDMEVLSKSQGQQGQAEHHPINLVNQSPDSVTSGYNAVNTSGYVVYPLAFNPTNMYADYRIDWLPGRIDMYANDVWINSFYDYVPNAPGALHLIHWSNGDPGWSEGPPTEDAVLTVSYVNAYFNTSTPSTNEGCSSDPTSNTTCVIPDTLAPQPTVPGSQPAQTTDGAASPAHTGGPASVLGYSVWSTFGVAMCTVGLGTIL